MDWAPRPEHTLPQEGLYGELASWADPTTIEAQLSAAAAARKRPLTRAEIAERKQARQEARRARKDAWLKDS